MGGEVGPKTMHVPSGDKMLIYDAAMRYQSEGTPTIILAGAEYGSGSSRDWAAKGPYLQVRAGKMQLVNVSLTNVWVVKSRREPGSARPMQVETIKLQEAIPTFNLFRSSS